MIKQELEGTLIKTVGDLNLYREYLESYRDLLNFKFRKALLTRVRDFDTVYAKPIKSSNIITILDSFDLYVYAGSLMDMVMYSSVCSGGRSEELSNEEIETESFSQSSSELSSNIKYRMFGNKTLLEVLKHEKDFEVYDFEEKYISQFIDSLYNLYEYTFYHKADLEEKPLIISEKW